MKVITGAVVQAGTVLFDKERTLEKLADLAQDAATARAKLIVFPEAFVGGYPKGLDFGVRLGMRSDEGRDLFRRYHDNAIDVPGEDTEKIGKIAASTNAYLVVGAIERDQGTLYCTALFFSPAGDLISKHRKLMPTAMERVVWGFGDGSTLPAPETDIGILGAVICWENYMPLLRTAMYSKGIQLYCAPTADDRPTWASTMQHVALEGRCFVLSCNQFTKRSDFPEDYDAIQGDDPETVISRGGSLIVNPLGQILAGPEFDKECILTADLDMGDIARGKYDFDVVGHYARPDVFRLMVNEKPMPAVVTNRAVVSSEDDPFAETNTETDAED